METSRDPLLPPGIRVGSGVGLDERPKVRVDVALARPGDESGADPDRLAFVMSPEEAYAVGLLMLDQDDRRVRTLGALLIRQAALVQREERGGLPLVGGGGS